MGQGAQKDFRTREDIERVVRAVAEHFEADEVVIVGSQAVMLTWDRPPPELRFTKEVDAYPGNFARWQSKNVGHVASEEIAANFGEGSNFHQTFKFFIDGVDDGSAVLPQGWRERAERVTVSVSASVRNGSSSRTVVALAPELPDLLVSKLVAFRDKDRAFIRHCHEFSPLDMDVMEERLRSCELDKHMIGPRLDFLRSLPKFNHLIEPAVQVPDHPDGTHRAFLSSDGKHVLIKEWSPSIRDYDKLGNTLGPCAVSADGTAKYGINGQIMPYEEWCEHPYVTEAQKSKDTILSDNHSIPPRRF